MLALTLALVGSTAPQDWPQYGGPNGDNRTGPVASDFAWGAEGAPVLWRQATIGPGFGGAAVQGDEVFLLDCELGESELLRVFSLASGEERWTHAYEAKGRVQFPGPRCVPAVTADAVYTTGAFGHATCFDRATKEIRWQEHLGETYGGEDPGFGFSGSPLVVGELVVFGALGADVGLVAFDRASGEERWVSDGLGLSHSSPALVTLRGEPQLVVLSTTATPTGQEEAAPMLVTSIDPADGRTKWQHEVALTRLPIPRVVQVDERRLFLTGGYRGGSKLLELAGDAGYEWKEVFGIARGAQVHAPLLHGEHLYVLVNENWNDPRPRRAEGGLLCLGLDGKERWRTGADPYFGRGPALLAGDHLLIQDGLNGTVRVVRATPEKYELVAESRPFPGDGDRDQQMWAPMALSGTRLLLRSQEELVCLNL